MRASLDPKNAEKLLFLNQNLKMKTSPEVDENFQKNNPRK